MGGWWPLCHSLALLFRFYSINEPQVGWGRLLSFPFLFFLIAFYGIGGWEVAMCCEGEATCEEGELVRENTREER